MSPTITIDEFLAELERLTPRTDSDGFTVTELADHLCVSTDVIRSRLRPLILSGLVTCSGRKTTLRMDGQRCQSPTYQFIQSGGGDGTSSDRDRSQ